MATRSSLTLLLLTLSSISSLVPAPTLSTLTGTHAKPKLRIDFDNSAYDFDNCGIPSGGRARRHGGEDYIDGMDFVVQPGVDSAKGEMPWAVAIQTLVPSSPSPLLCAGTLISRRHVLTAAHCLSTKRHLPVKIASARCNSTDYIPLEDFMYYSEVKFGGECLEGSDSSCTEDMTAKTAHIKRIVLFPFFEMECSEGRDVMLLELDQNVDVPHACLPHLHDVDIRPDSSFSTFGWGAVDRQNGSDAHSDRLQKHQLSLMKHNCVQEWDHISPDVLCVAQQKHISQCAGESGAGLISTISRRSFLVGTLASTSSCAPEDLKNGEARFTDTRLYSSTFDAELLTVGPYPDGRGEEAIKRGDDYKPYMPNMPK